MSNIFAFDENFNLQVFALNFGGYLQLLMSLSFLKIPFFCFDIRRFLFTLVCGTSKGFMKALEAFIKPFEAPQRSVKRCYYGQN